MLRLRFLIYSISVSSSLKSQVVVSIKGCLFVDSSSGAWLCVRFSLCTGKAKIIFAGGKAC